MNLYDKNLSAFTKYNAQLANMLTSTRQEKYRTEPARSGRLTLIFHIDNQDFYIHSKFKPEDEALKLVGTTKIETEHIIVLGLGLGYHIDILMNSKPKQTRVLLIEPDLEIIKHSMHTIQWDKLLERDDFFFCIGYDLNLLAASIQRFIDVTVFNGLEFIELASEVRFHQSFFNEVRQVMDNEIRTILYDFKTRLAEDAMVPKNILKNIGGILQTRPVKSLKNRFAGKPGFIASAGPSLDKNILLLKKIKDRGVILCVDTALKPLLKRNIQPHFVITADPSYKNYLHLQGTETAIKHFLVSDTGISSRVYDDFSEHLFSVSLGKPILKMIEPYTGEIGELEAWGSVISLALTFAIYIGLNPIVFMGQDFAFTGMKNHCRGTTWEDTWLENSKDLDRMQREELKSIGGISRVAETPDIYGFMTKTSDKLLLYKNYMVKFFSSFPANRFINASEGGILNEIETVPLQKVLEDYVFKNDPIDFKSLFDIPRMGTQGATKKIIAFFKSKSDFFGNYKKKLEESISRLKSAKQLPAQAAFRTLESAHDLKNQLYANPQNGEIVEMWSQGPIFDFLKRYKKLEPQKVNESNLNEWIDLFKDYYEKLLPLVSNIIDSLAKTIETLREERNDRQNTAKG